MADCMAWMIENDSMSADGTLHRNQFVLQAVPRFTVLTQFKISSLFTEHRFEFWFSSGHDSYSSPWIYNPGLTWHPDSGW